MTLKKRQSGISLIELMVAIAMGLIVLSGVLSVVLNILRANSENMRTMRLNQELRAIMDTMVRDIRRAGFRSNYAVSIGTISSGQSLSNTVTIEDSGATLKYNYDLNGNGTFDPAENYGFRLAQVSSVGAVQSRSRNSANPNTDIWTTLSDPKATQIDTLEFCFWAASDNTCSTTFPEASKVTVSGNAKVSVYDIRITLQGKLLSDNSTTRKLVETVRVRNDAFENAP